MNSKVVALFYGYLLMAFFALVVCLTYASLPMFVVALLLVVCTVMVPVIDDLEIHKAPVLAIRQNYALFLSLHGAIFLVLIVAGL